MAVLAPIPPSRPCGDFKLTRTRLPLQRLELRYGMNVSTGGRPEDRARANIDRLLMAAGWLIQNRDSIDIEAGRGIAIREFPLATGYGFADYLLYVDGYAAGVVEAKKTGVPLIGVEIQTAKYSVGLPQNLPALRRPLPFCYESTG